MAKTKFTLIELLIVVAIIGILLTLLVPSLRRAREAAKFAVCKSNQTQQYRLLLTAANGNNGRLPQIDHKGFANNPSTNLDFIKHSWYGAQKRFFKMKNPTMGLYTEEFSFLRCPSLDEGVKGSTVGSNGSYDYGVTAAFSIAMLSKISTESRWGVTWNSGKSVMTPLIMDEDTQSINGRNGEGGFCQRDMLSIRHMLSARRGSYTGIDGSAQNYPGSGSLRNFYKFYTAMENGRYDWLRVPTDPDVSPANGFGEGKPDSRIVWDKRSGMGDL
ncbi:MAG: type II secretion system GspH family protein [Lentisphaeraceae bacterium]|nr:type II secretion system GspH family protein [Lentisphaeraceae bacterium]